MTKKRYCKVRKKLMVRMTKTAALCASLLAVWYAVMFLIGWYDAGFHLVATAFSVLMISTGRSWGVLGTLVE